MLGISSLSALLGLLVVVLGVILLLTRKRRALAVACLIAGILLIFVPVTAILLLTE